MRRKKVIHSFSQRCWAEVCTGSTSHCLCSLCTFAAVGLSIREVYFKLERVYMSLFFFLSLRCLVPVCVAQVESACAHSRDGSGFLCVRNLSSHTGVGLYLFVCAVRSHKDGNDTSQSRGSSEN